MTAWELSQQLLGRPAVPRVTNKWIKSSIDHFKVTLNVHGCCWKVDHRFFNIVCVCVCVCFSLNSRKWCSRSCSIALEQKLYFEKRGDLRPPKLPLEDDERAEKWCLGPCVVVVVVVFNRSVVRSVFPKALGGAPRCVPRMRQKLYIKINEQQTFICMVTLGTQRLFTMTWASSACKVMNI